MVVRDDDREQRLPTLSHALSQSGEMKGNEQVTVGEENHDHGPTVYANKIVSCCCNRYVPWNKANQRVSIRLAKDSSHDSSSSFEPHNNSKT